MSNLKMKEAERKTDWQIFIVMWANAVLKDASCREQYSIEQETLHICSFNSHCREHYPGQVRLFLSINNFLPPLAKAHLSCWWRKRNNFMVCIYSLYSSPSRQKLPWVMRASSLVFRINLSCMLIFKRKSVLSAGYVHAAHSATSWELYKLSYCSKQFTTMHAFLPAQNSPVNCC